MRRTAFFIAAALQLAVPLAAIAQTQTTGSSTQTAPTTTQTTTASTQTTTTQTTTQGSGQVGEHVSGVAPEHPREEGRHFGECVSELAITGECPHEHEEQ